MRIVQRLALALAVAVGMMGAAATPALAAYPGARPPDGTTQEQPFAPGTGGSANFRIPAMVTLDNGTVVAATDARWNTTGDGGGLDTMVSRSTDNGATWSYTFANYLGDNGNAWNGASTAFIDPALATDGQTVYMIADLFPAGIALNSANWAPQVGEAFDDAGNLRLRAADEVAFGCDGYSAAAARAAYDYYLDLESLTIHSVSDGSEVAGYTVDDHFNITDAAGDTTNLFCGDAPFQVFPTAYLYLTSSTDGGATWSAPTLIDVKDSDEQVVIIGPGTGTVLDDGTLVFSAYEYTSGKQLASIIYSTDGGATWTRSADATDYGSHWSSEAVTVDMGNGTIRQFYRDGYATLFYTDYVRENGAYVPGTPVDSGAVKTSNNQIAAIRYSKQIDGRDAIIVSMASSGSRDRTSGKLHVGLIEDDGSITWQYVYDVVPDGSYYAYSTLTELSDGSIAIIYEEAAASERYVVVPLDEVVCDGTNVDLKDITVREVSFPEGERTATVEVPGFYTADDLADLDASVVTAQVDHADGAFAADGSEVAIEDCLYTFTSDGTGGFTAYGTLADGGRVWLSPSGQGAGYPWSAQPANLEVATGIAEDLFTIGDGERYLYFKGGVFDRVSTLAGFEDYTSFALYRPMDAEGRAARSASEIDGYERVSRVDEMADGAYLVGAQQDDGLHLLRPSDATSSKSAHVATMGKKTMLTLTAVGPGTTEVRLGNTRLVVTVPEGADTEGPALPEEPSVPGSPEQPVEPDRPLVPVEPGQPVEPDQPLVPIEPALPLEPDQPLVPVEPAEPMDPGTPMVPLEPAEPVEQDAPLVPIEPANPVKPDAPEVPEVPGNPEQPGDAEPPQDIDAPMVPIEPAKPMEPAQTQKPGDDASGPGTQPPAAKPSAQKDKGHGAAVLPRTADAASLAGVAVSAGAVVTGLGVAVRRRR